MFQSLKVRNCVGQFCKKRNQVIDLAQKYYEGSSRKLALVQYLCTNRSVAFCTKSTIRCVNTDSRSSTPKQRQNSLVAELIAKQQVNEADDHLEFNDSNETSVEIEELIEKYESLRKDINREYLDIQEKSLDDNDDAISEDTNLNSDDSNYFLEELLLDSDEAHLPTCPRKPHGIRSIYGTADPKEPMSDVPCSGCGAKLHCQNPAIPGYLPKEKFKTLDVYDFKMSTCQSCFLINYHNFCLKVRAKSDDYPSIISEIKKRKGLVVLVVDMLDVSNSFIQDLPKLVGNRKNFFVIGNKVDLLPKDSSGYLHHCLLVLQDWCIRSGLSPHQIQHTCLVSAKTGYGIEELVNKLIKEFQPSKQGDVFLLGSTNSGKSTLFNALLSSDYCKYHVRDVIHRATVSRWPGTTIDLLKFPIMAPTSNRLQLRTQRLVKERFAQSQNTEQLRGKKGEKQHAGRHFTLAAPIGQTDFRPESVRHKQEEHTEGEITFQDMVLPPTYSVDDEGEVSVGSRSRDELYRETKAERKERQYTVDHLGEMDNTGGWLCDTPGLINTNQIINILSPEELSVVLPTGLISPRSFILKPGEVMFVSGLGRIDYIQGTQSVYLTVISSPNIPVHVTKPGEADSFYHSNAGTKLLGVPLGGRDRLKSFPSLVGQDFEIDGIGWRESAADVVLSSLGFVSVTAGTGMNVRIRAFTPGARGCRVVRPALLPYAVGLRGERLKGTAKYRVRRWGNKKS